MQKTFRLFVSSTFGDFTEERKLLQTVVFPEIKKYCSSKKLSFQPIDLRWGVTEDASNDQKTLELCIEEVQNCKLQPYPNFLIMLGDRCGTIILPYTINKEEFETILNNVKKYKRIEKLLKTWYKLDENQIPASYIIEQRKDAQNSHDGIDYTIRNNWKPINTRLIKIFKIVVSKIDLEESKKNKYFKSATEVEVIEGIFKYLDKTPFQNRLLEKDSELINKDHEHVYSYIRNIRTLDNETLKDRFIDEDISDVKRFKETLKSSIKEENIYEVNVNLTNIKQDEKNYSLNYQYDEIKNRVESEFVNRIITYLKKSIDEYSNLIKDLTPKELELEEQKRFKNDKLKDFLEDSRKEALEKIDTYINSENENNQVLVVYGKSGLGKSSLMAKAIENNEIKFENTDTKVIYKFVGSTANLTNTPEILISILNELGINEEIRKITNAQTMQEESEKLEEFYERICEHFLKIKDNVIIFLDAIDQLSNEDKFIWVPKNLPNNLKIIISALDDENYEEDSKYLQDLKTKTINLYPLEEFDTNFAKQLILNILKRYDRTIIPSQMNYLLDIHKDVKTPLYLSVAAQELRHWKSSDTNQTLAISQSEIIKEFIENLTKLFHHDKEFVKRVFSYLYLSDGLSESELLEILSMDEEFIEYIAPDTYHKKESNELPIVIWARLYSQIKEFLKLEQKDTQETMSFFHREFNEVIKNQEDIKEIHQHLITLLQNLIIKYQNEEFDSNRWGKLYIEIVKKYHLEHEFEYLPDENTNLYEWCLIISKVDDNYLESLTDYLNKLGFINNEINETKLTSYFLKSYYYLSEKLSIQNSFLFLKKYISSLNNLAVFLNNIGETKESLKIEEKSLEILKFKYQEEPNKWEEYYIRTLNNLASICNSLGKTDFAIHLQLENYEILEPLYDKEPNIWGEYYIRCLNNLSVFLSSIDELNDAINFQVQSLNILDIFYVKNNEKWAKSYIIGLNNLASILVNIEEVEESIKLNKKALEICKTLYKQDSKIWAKDYITCINNLAFSLQKNGEVYEAKNLQKKVINLLKQLYKKEPKKWFFYYLDCLENFVYSFESFEEHYQIINFQKEILKIRKQLLIKEPNKWIELYNICVENLTVYLKEIKQENEIISLQKEVLKTIKFLYEENSSRWAEDYTTRLNDLAGSYAKNRDFKESSKLFEEYFKIVDFNNIDDIRDFIYPFIKYYQCEKHLKDYLKLEELKDLALNFRNLYKEKFDNKFEEEINEIFEVYKDLSDNSDDDFDKEKFEIFQLIFFR